MRNYFYRLLFLVVTLLTALIICGSRLSSLAWFQEVFAESNQPSEEDSDQIYGTVPSRPNQASYLEGKGAKLFQSQLGEKGEILRSADDIAKAAIALVRKNMNDKYQCGCPVNDWSQPCQCSKECKVGIATFADEAKVKGTRAYYESFAAMTSDVAGEVMEHATNCTPYQPIRLGCLRNALLSMFGTIDHIDPKMPGGFSVVGKSIANACSAPGLTKEICIKRLKQEVNRQIRTALRNLEIASSYFGWVSIATANRGCNLPEKNMAYIAKNLPLFPPSQGGTIFHILQGPKKGGGPQKGSKEGQDDSKHKESRQGDQSSLEKNINKDNPSGPIDQTEIVFEKSSRKDNLPQCAATQDLAAKLKLPLCTRFANVCTSHPDKVSKTLPLCRKSANDDKKNECTKDPGYAAIHPEIPLCKEDTKDKTALASKNQQGIDLKIDDTENSKDDNNPKKGQERESNNNQIGGKGDGKKSGTDPNATSHGSDDTGSGKPKCDEFVRNAYCEYSGGKYDFSGKLEKPSSMDKARIAVGNILGENILSITSAGYNAAYLSEGKKMVENDVFAFAAESTVEAYLAKIIQSGNPITPEIEAKVNRASQCVAEVDPGAGGRISDRLNAAKAVAKKDILNALGTTEHGQMSLAAPCMGAISRRLQDIQHDLALDVEITGTILSKEGTDALLNKIFKPGDYVARAGAWSASQLAANSKLGTAARLTGSAVGGVINLIGGVARGLTADQPLIKYALIKPLTEGHVFGGLEKVLERACGGYGLIKGAGIGQVDPDDLVRRELQMPEEQWSKFSARDKARIIDAEWNRLDPAKKAEILERRIKASYNCRQKSEEMLLLSGLMNEMAARHASLNQEVKLPWRKDPIMAYDYVTEEMLRQDPVAAHATKSQGLLQDNMEIGKDRDYLMAACAPYFHNIQGIEQPTKDRIVTKKLSTAAQVDAQIKARSGNRRTQLRKTTIDSATEDKEDDDGFVISDQFRYDIGMKAIDELNKAPAVKLNDAALEPHESSMAQFCDPKFRTELAEQILTNPAARQQYLSCDKAAFAGLAEALTAQDKEIPWELKKIHLYWGGVNTPESNARCALAGSSVPFLCRYIQEVETHALAQKIVPQAIEVATDATMFHGFTFPNLSPKHLLGAFESPSAFRAALAMGAKQSLPFMALSRSIQAAGNWATGAAPASFLNIADVSQVQRAAQAQATLCASGLAFDGYEACRSALGEAKRMASMDHSFGKAWGDFLTGKMLDVEELKSALLVDPEIPKALKLMVDISGEIVSGAAFGAFGGDPRKDPAYQAWLKLPETIRRRTEMIVEKFVTDIEKLNSIKAGLEKVIGKGGKPAKAAKVLLDHINKKRKELLDSLGPENAAPGALKMILARLNAGNRPDGKTAPEIPNESKNTGNNDASHGDHMFGQSGYDQKTRPLAADTPERTAQDLAKSGWASLTPDMKSIIPGEQPRQARENTKGAPVGAAFANGKLYIDPANATEPEMTTALNEARDWKRIESAKGRIEADLKHNATLPKADRVTEKGRERLRDSVKIVVETNEHLKKAEEALNKDDEGTATTELNEASKQMREKIALRKKELESSRNPAVGGVRLDIEALERRLDNAKNRMRELADFKEQKKKMLTEVLADPDTNEMYHYLKKMRPDEEWEALQIIKILKDQAKKSGLTGKSIFEFMWRYILDNSGCRKA